MTITTGEKTGRLGVRSVKESAIQRQITDLLTAEGIFWMRNNVGAASGVYKGKKWFMRFGQPGMADLVAFIRHGGDRLHTILWIECKTEKGAQSGTQMLFELNVKDHGHWYLLARSSDDVLEFLKSLRRQASLAAQAFGVAALPIIPVE